jgi:spermidine synthase
MKKWISRVEFPEGEPIFNHQSDFQTINVRQDGQLRLLKTDDATIQSAINLDAPHELILPYMQAMLACLLFQATPNNTLLLGLGGGAMVRYLHHHLPACKITAVEIDKEMINTCRNYFGLPDVPQINIQCIDAATFLKNTTEHYDSIFIDIHSNTNPPTALQDKLFIKSLYEALTDNGIAITNLITNNTEVFKDILWKTRQQFQQLTLCMTIPEHDNILIFAFKQKPTQIKRGELMLKARTLSTHYALDFESFVDNIFSNNPLDKGELIL